MYILGINSGHNGTAALLKDRAVIGCISEERLTRVKNRVGFPERSIELLLNTAGITSKELDKVLVATREPRSQELFLFAKSFMELGAESLSKRLYRHLAYTYPKFGNMLSGMKRGIERLGEGAVRKRVFDYYANSLKTDPGKIVFADHHLLHSFSTLFNLPGDEKWLIFSLDGEGDGLCATVNLYQNGELHELAHTANDSSLGWLYLSVTKYLGMRPNEDEFKVMGLAPYAKNIEEPHNLLKSLIWLEGLTFKSKFRLQNSLQFLRQNFGRFRFDNIAGAIQRLTEDLTTRWVSTGIQTAGVRNVALAGGVFMNVKANLKIAQIPELERLWVVPSCGDESLAIGACLYGYWMDCKEKSAAFNPQPLRDLYLGPEYTNQEIARCLKARKYQEKHAVKQMESPEEEVAKLLAEGEIVARFRGRMEWGARALGNRSILANPSDRAVVRKINEQIKGRDFWMPFAPSILEEDEGRYVVNTKELPAPYMVTAFESTKEARRDLAAAIHPYDFTLRPQAVDMEQNPPYYRLIQEFKNLTGIGGVLNTSFNLHGEPIVCSPEDALHTFENSGLQHLAVGNYLVSKK